MKHISGGQKEIFVVYDMDGTQLHSHDFAKNVKLLIKKECWGLYNLVCDGQTNRMEVASELLRLLNLEKEIKLVSVKSDYFKDIYFAERPPNERLINKKLDLKNLNIMRDWKSALKEYLENYYQDYLNSHELVTQEPGESKHGA